MEEILLKLRKERFELTGKIKKLENFRGTDEWNKLSTNHKQLLDIQLQAMRTYLETLIGRCLDIEENMNKPKEKEDNEDLTKVIVIGLGEIIKD